jgi:hypothetical protein
LPQDLPHEDWGQAPILTADISHARAASRLTVDGAAHNLLTTAGPELATAVEAFL